MEMPKYMDQNQQNFDGKVDKQRYKDKDVLLILDKV